VGSKNIVEFILYLWDNSSLEHNFLLELNMSNTAWTTCLKITRTDGVILGLTEFDREITIDSVKYLSAAGYTPTVHSSSDGLAVDNADVEGLLDIAGINRSDISVGLYDLAAIELFIWDWQSGTKIKTIASGHWGECTLYQGRFVAEFRSLAQKLQQTIGRIYTAACDAELGDSRCSINIAPLTVTGTITNQTSPLQIVDTARTEANGRWSGGVLTFNSGSNINRSYEVRTSLSSGHITLLLPLSYNVNIGDSYTLRPGCNKSLEMCRNLYSNSVNFRGFPHVPGTMEILRIGKRST